jgi:inward rectifier potassium channel
VARLKPVYVRSAGVRAVKLGAPTFDLTDPYYLLLQMRWSSFMALVLAMFLAVNLVFATLYWAVPGSIENARPHQFGDAFFFSIETLATVGYGRMVPLTVYGHVVAACEVLAGMFLTALVTGGFFARFARPQARLLFTQSAVIAPYGSGRALMVRVASRRAHSISEMVARMTVLPGRRSSGLHSFRSFIDLKMVRKDLPVLSLSWTLIHPIDEKSPFFDLDPEALAQSGMILIVSVSGFDEAISATINGRRAYYPEDLRVNHVFSDISSDLPGGVIQIDLTRFHDTEPAPD